MQRMFYRDELRFLCDVLHKSRLHARLVAPNALYGEGQNAKDDLIENDPWSLPQIPETITPHTLYHYTDPRERSYTYLLLPKAATATVLLVGPYLKAPVAPAQQYQFDKYYEGIPVLDERDNLFLMINTFCERIWESASFVIVDVNQMHKISASPINEPMHNDKFDDVLVNMRVMEKRYAFENELIRAVSLGQLHKENELLSAFSFQAFERRLSDPLRNAKNYAIIMNTLLRKAAEKGGVHPLYLDRVSSEFAAKIEHLSALSENFPLMREMYRTYCRLVRRHALTRFSLVVQKAVLMIDSDLSATLSLKTLADHQNVSPSYLSAIFKKDTGKTVSEYIRLKRIEHAEHLLATTSLQIQTVASHCGIMDVQYFSKTFKKLTGKTPKEYRDLLKEPQKT